MSNPKVYGHCDAGCKRRVPTYDEFLRSAAYMPLVADENGRYAIEVGKKYKVYSTTKSTTKTFSADLSVTNTDENITKLLEGLFAYRSPYEESFALQILGGGYGADDYGSAVYGLHYLYNETANKKEVDAYGLSGTPKFYITNASKVLRVNEEAEILIQGRDGIDGKSAYEIACDYGFKGTEEEWLESLKGGNGGNGEGGTTTPETENSNTEVFQTTGSVGLTYDLYDDYAVCIGTQKLLPTSIEIGSIVKGLPVKSIADDAFSGKLSITSVIIPDSIEEIGNGAFNGCRLLKEVIIGSGVKTIGNSAFKNCKNLKDVTIPNGVTTISGSAFYGCEFTSIKIPASVVNINQSAFEECKKLSNITVDLDNEHYKSADGNLYSKDGKTLVKYASAKSDERFTIPNDVTHIGIQAFKGSTNLTSIVVGENVEQVGSYAFSECTNLSEVFYKGTEAMWSGVVVNTNNEPLSKATIYYYSETEPANEGNYWHYVNDVVTAWIKSAEGDVSTEGLAYELSADNTYYKVVGIGSLTEETEIEIPSEYGGVPVKRIKFQAFMDCNNITKITIPDSVTHIEACVFYRCTNLESVSIGSGVKYIGAQVFLACTNLKEIIVDESNQYYTTDVVDRFLLTKDGKTAVHYALGHDAGCIVPDGVEIIDSYAVAQSKATMATFPNTVTQIHANAFRACKELKTIYIRPNLKSIGAYAFYGCTALETVCFYGELSDFSVEIDKEGNECFTNAKIVALGVEEE